MSFLRDNHACRDLDMFDERELESSAGDERGAVVNRVHI